MSGRLGGVKVVILPSRDYAEGNSVNRSTATRTFCIFRTVQQRRRGRRSVRRLNHASDPAKVDQWNRPADRQQMEDDVVPF